MHYVFCIATALITARASPYNLLARQEETFCYQPDVAVSVFGTRVAVARACQKSICFSNIDQLVVYLSIQIPFIPPHKKR